MMDRDALRRAVLRTACGYLFLHLNFTLNTLNLLPNWVGYLLMLRALAVLAKKTPSTTLLRPLGKLLALVEFFDWGAKLLGITLNVPLLAPLVVAAALYFHFQLLTDLAAIAERYDCQQEKTRILLLRTVRTVLITILSLPLPWQAVQWLAVLMTTVHLIVAFWSCAVLFSLHRSLELKEET